MNRSGLDQPRVSRVLVERYVARLRKRQRWRRLSVTVTVLLLLLTGTGYYLLWHTKVFDVRTVKVSGTRVLTRDQILAAAAIPSHEPVAGVDTDAVKKRLMSLPRVKSAVVERDLPHAVLITVVERVPAAALPDADGGYTIVDADGVAFDTAATWQLIPNHVPVIDLRPAATVTEPPAQTRATVIDGALAALRALPPAVRGRVRSIAATGPFAISLELEAATAKGKPVVVNWGGADQPALKAKVLTILLAKGFDHYDVSAPEAPAYS
jgi:cell division protein FtsQ